MAQKETISKWVELRKFRGHYVFTFEDVRHAFPSYSFDYLKSSLSRLIAANIIIAPARGFYVIVPTEYALGAGVPPTFYIDQMMRFLQRDYYIGLLNAAEFYGAAHQRPQAFSVFNTPPDLRNSLRANTQFCFICKRTINENLVAKRPAKLGTINLSTPEATMLDLVMFEERVGGLNRVCTVLNELVDVIEVGKLEGEVLSVYPLSVCQRLGHILEYILDEEEKAEALYTRLRERSVTFRKTPFKKDKPVVGCPTDERWKVIVNQEIDIDE